MIHSDARQLAYGQEALATKKRLSVFEVRPEARARPTHSLDLHCHYDINEMPLKRCVCSVTRGRGWEERREIDVEPT